MGEAKRKRRMRERYGDDEWVKLFDSELPVTYIFRPGRSHPPQMAAISAAQIERYAKTDRPWKCFTPDCGAELRTVPEVCALTRTTETEGVTSGFCVGCGQKSDDEILALLREEFHHFGPRPEGSAKVPFEVMTVYRIEIEGGEEIRVADGLDVQRGKAVASALAELLATNKLPNFTAFRRGRSNCHFLCKMFFDDARDHGFAHLFAFRAGSSELLKSDHDPNGLHSWIEADGFAIDVAGGGDGNPILIQPVADYYKQRQITNIRDRLDPAIEELRIETSGAVP